MEKGHQRILTCLLSGVVLLELNIPESRDSQVVLWQVQCRPAIQLLIACSVDYQLASLQCACDLVHH